MGKMYQWYNPKGDRPLRLIALEKTKLGDALMLRAARPGEKGQHIFNPETELDDLWETIRKGGSNVRSDNLMLFSDEINADTGNGELVEADIRNEKNDAYGYAYTAKQVASFAGQHVAMLAGMFHQPVLVVGMLEYKRKSSGGTPRAARETVVRMTAPKAPQTGGVQRRSKAS